MQITVPISYSVRLRVIGKYSGFILLVGLGFLIVPLVASLIFQEYEVSIRYGIVMAVFLVLGLASLKISKPSYIQSNEAYVIIALAFIISSLALVYPLMEVNQNIIDCWFEAVSGLTTSGLSVMDVGSIKSPLFFFARAWMQWTGGIGIIVFSIGMALQSNLVSKALYKKIAYQDDLRDNSRIFAKKMMTVYASITVLAIIILVLNGLNLFDAIIFSFASVSTGGFSPFNDSLASLTISAQSWIIAFGFIGAISFPIFWITSAGGLKRFLTDRQLYALFICSLFFSTALVFLSSSEWIAFIPSAILNAVSIQSTTGFSTFDLSTMTQSSKLIMVASMLIGGSTQSTAGGLKLIRTLILLKAVYILFLRTTLPKHGNLNKGTEELQHQAYSCFILFFLYILVIFVSTLLFVIMGYNFLDSLFEVSSALGTVGVSSGVTNASLPALLKFVLIADMFLGRLEIVTLLILFYPKTFIGRRLKS